ncbi:aldo/keto reductase [Paenibacillus sp. WQ 127069]|uniref:Aldo/keto reductase n=1 Tax=Paenibacillus baimaensis TaxID=2982185 RepID=A0ABT2UKA9_9BACL|nr:aldo/keto reductase [Paenibacillus sp. WQ 127069]MCU6795074.1 aldo/keto reductase [Paenibacillus sp. WQ 127069]
MKYRKLGNSGLKVSLLGLGTNALGGRADQEESIRIIGQAIDKGINFIDTANIYTKSESERIIGLALEGKRHEVVLATKAGLVRGSGPNERGSSRFHLQQELEGSLRRLKTDYVDLYQIHTFDPETPLEETLRTLEDMVSSGKVRYIGASNYAAWELMKALGISERQGWNRFISHQICYSLADRTPEQELVPISLDQGVGIIPYFPLAGGILTGKYTSVGAAPEGSRADKDPNFGKFLTDERLQLSQSVSELAAKWDCTPGNLSLSWLMHNPVVSTVIVGASGAAQLEENYKSLSIELNADQLQELDRVSEYSRYGKPFAHFRLPQA